MTDMIKARRGLNRQHRWPYPIYPVPSQRMLTAWRDMGRAEATDGCVVNIDGVCKHGYPSWLLYLGLL